MTIDEVQDDIVNEFEILAGDQEMTVLYIMELGQKLPALKEEDKADQNLVKGCQSKVWLTASIQKGRVFFNADSNTAITKGLVSLLIRLFNGHTPEEILDTDLTFMGRIGMERFIGTQRSNGFSAMIRQMKYYALALKAKTEVKS